jgi:hypothetical protein
MFIHRRRTTRSRKGFVLTTIILFVLPLVLFVGLALVQWNLLKTVQERLHVAAERAAVCACCCQSVDVSQASSVDAAADRAHDCAGLVLGYLGGDYKTEIQFFDDADSDTLADEVQVGVTIPLAAASTNYMGLLCGIGVDNVRMRAVVRIRCRGA